MISSNNMQTINLHVGMLSNNQKACVEMLFSTWKRNVYLHCVVQSPLKENLNNGSFQNLNSNVVISKKLGKHLTLLGEHQIATILD